jgi:hypothetical protein
MNPQITKNMFISKANALHNFKYDYSLVEYNGYRKIVKIICPLHGEFIQTVSNHLLGSECPSCGHIISKAKKQMSQKEFIDKANNKHINKYDYSKVNYVNNYTRVILICHKHGEFLQVPSNHLRGQGCPLCKNSKGENTIKKFLEDNQVTYIPQKTFDDCRGKTNKLPFDFYLPNYNICIEYQGEQHFRAVTCWGGEMALNKTKVTDKLKKEYCSLKGIKLLEILYNTNPIKLLEETLQRNPGY